MRVLLVLLSCLALALTGSTTAASGTKNMFRMVEGSAGPVLDFLLAEINVTQSADIPLTGWSEPRPVVGVFPLWGRVAHDPDRNAIAWYRIRFSRAEAGAGPLAFQTDHTAERILVYLNGIDVYRSFDRADRFRFGWNQPRMAPLPERLIKEAGNELIVRVDAPSPGSVRMGGLRIGPYDSVWADNNWRRWVRIEGPRTINGVLFILTVATLLFWVVRRQESIFGWISLLGIVWFVRNLHYYIDQPPIDIWAFWHLTHISLFVLMAVIYGFVATFMGLSNRKRLLAILGVAAISIAVLHLSEVRILGGVPPAMLATIPLSIWVLWIFLKHALAIRSLDATIMLSALTVAFAMSVHDFGLLLRAWDGAEFYLQPYGSLLVYSAFCFAIGRRLLIVLSVVEDSNQVLEQRVAAATVQLQINAEELKRLEVMAAVEQERTRLMREIHDGIGSNLVTALAVAQNQSGNDQTVDTLKRSIADLRAAIDSLEPTDGDLTLLLASFRHRMEPELRKVGLVLHWKVDVLPPLEWLEATNALHILRIFQEIMANIIKHAQASEVAVDCRAEERAGRAGICVEFIDNGIGLSPSVQQEGKGISNMHSRAASLFAQISIAPAEKQRGTCVALWLPYDRRTNARLKQRTADASVTPLEMSDR